jgi:F-type H+-transporting ATPase subunit delta
MPEQIQTKIPSVLEDPSALAVAKVYAEAFLKAARSDTSGVEGSLEEFRSFIDEVLGKFPDFARILTSSVIGRDEKLEIIERSLAGRGSELFVNFLRVLARHDRLDLLPLICETSEKQHELSTGRRRVQLTTAIPLNDNLQNRIAEQIQQRLGFIPILEPRVDPSILGGLIVRVGDSVYDTSVRTRLKQLRDRLRQRTLHEIQSGRDRFSSHS